MTSQNFDLTEAEAFHRFLREQLDNGRRDKSPEELLAQWRDQHRSVEASEDSIAAVREALADMDAGDTGRPARRVVDELRRKHNLRRGA